MVLLPILLTKKKTKKWLEEVLDWLSSGPDLNSIENIKKAPMHTTKTASNVPVSAMGMDVLKRSRSAPFHRWNRKCRKLYKNSEGKSEPSITKLAACWKYIFQQDGASSHTAKKTKKWVEEVLDWLSSGPDFNLI